MRRCKDSPDPSFASLRNMFEANFAAGLELGASVAITVEGQPVVDLWGGWADEDRTRPWREDTIVNVFSTTKTLMALTALVLADRGELDLDAPVARYWPEFAANGKVDVKVSHLLAHSSGLSGWHEAMASADLYDWEKATSLLAAQAPFWTPGTASGYHGVTQGFLVGEVVRRVTGRSIGTVFRQEIAEPLGADFRIGTPAAHDARTAEIVPPRQTLRARALTQLMTNIAVNPPLDPLATRTRAWREAEIPAANGHGNARSVAKILSLLANGGEAGGRRFLSEAGCRKAAELQIEGVDLVLGVPARFGPRLRPARRMAPDAQSRLHLLDGLGRLDRVRGHGGEDQLRLRDEPHGRRHAGRQAGLQDDPGDVAVRRSLTSIVARPGRQRSSHHV